MTLTYSIRDLGTTAQALIKKSTFKTWLFYAPMGAGKTTLIKALAKELGVNEMASSPTFSIVNEYAGATEKIHHFDLYRLKNEEEAYDMGLEEYFNDSNTWCFVEWPEMALSVLPEKVHTITITIIDENTRALNFD